MQRLRFQPLVAVNRRQPRFIRGHHHEDALFRFAHQSCDLFQCVSLPQLGNFSSWFEPRTGYGLRLLTEFAEMSLDDIKAGVVFDGQCHYGCFGRKKVPLVFCGQLESLSASNSLPFDSEFLQRPSQDCVRGFVLLAELEKGSEFRRQGINVFWIEGNRLSVFWFLASKNVPLNAMTVQILNHGLSMYAIFVFQNGN